MVHVSEVLCGGLKKSESEFQQGLTAACGPNALSAALRWSDQSATTPGTYAVYQTGRSLPNPIDANGASTLSELEATAAKMGYPTTLPFTGESASAFVRRVAGIEPIVLEIAAGHNLVDTLTGAGEDAGPDLAYHYICVWGRNTGGASGRTSRVLPPGYWCSDGDNNTQNPVVNGARVHRTLNSDLVYYSDATLAAALPYGAFSVQPHVRVAQEVYMAIPSGWKDDGVTLTAPNGVAVVHGFRDFVLAFAGGWFSGNTPHAGEYVTATGSRQDFRFTSLAWTSGKPVALVALGDELATAQATITTLQQQMGAQAINIQNILSERDALAAKLAAAQAQLTAAQEQIASLQAQNGPAQALAAAVLAVVNASSSSTQKAA